MEADIMTKPITKPDYWKNARLNISIAWPSEVKWHEVQRQQTATSSSKAAAAQKARPRYLVEYCCGEDSLLGQTTKHSEGCISVRLTEAHDMTTKYGMDYAKSRVSEANRANGDILLWSAMPCTGGSPWQNYNKRFESARVKIQQHIELFDKLWCNFEKLVSYTQQQIKQSRNKSQGQPCASRMWTAIEWPKDCSYWRLDKVRAFIYRNQLQTRVINGCMLDLFSTIHPGKLIPKPWIIETDSECLSFAFEDRTCNRQAAMLSGKTREHAACEGKDTKLTENYTSFCPVGS
jgi:hypothetical protein